MRNILIFSIIFSMIPFLNYAEEYSFVSPAITKKQITQYDFFNYTQVPNVQLITQCNKDGKDCWKEVWSSQKKILTFSSKDSISEIASGRYSNLAYSLLKKTFETGSGKKKKTQTDHYLIDSSGKTTRYNQETDKKAFGGIPFFTKDAILTNKGELMIATKEEILFFDLKGILKSRTKIPEQVNSVILRNNPNGMIGCLAISQNEELLLSNTLEFVKTGIYLAAKGDRMDVLSVYPGAGNVFYGVVYKYVNIFNKGLYLFKYDFNSKKLVQGYLFNSEDRNVGFKPQLFEDKNQIVVSSRDSTHRDDIVFNIKKENFDKIESQQPSHIQGFENEEFFSLLAGGGISNIWWIANSKIKKNNITYANVDYNISSSLMYKGFFEGRIGDTHLGLSYLKNQTDNGSMNKTTSQFFSAFASLDGILPASTTFRIVYEQSSIKGTALFTKNVSGTMVSSNADFQNKYDRILAMAILERGLFFGFDYTSYKMPTAVGFSDTSKNIVYSDFDPNFTMNIYSLILGYDMLAYAKRYEVNLNQFYLDGYMGLGLGLADISSTVKESAKTNTGKTDIKTPVFGSLNGSLSVGFIYQRRSKSLSGLGLVLQIGYQIKGNLLFAGQSSDNQDEKLNNNELALEMQRSDIQHGPFFQISIVW